ncbi:MAG TPA: tripartite tricarboxylate transporter substrate binding protein [Burkholderiales bacterium]|jgi:tripartite-type tricarboxylate transporter receptor subunit TctC|nr:tripartite tricarboxylate transporter substrate binding protein [Burkholderiales bacterium]
MKKSLLLLLLCAASGAFAQYPSKPVRLVVPYAAGGPADLLTREIAKGLQDAVHQPVIVDPRPGGGTMIGAELVAKAPPDGYTLLVSTAASLIVSPSMEPHPRYDGLKDFAPIAMVAYVPNLISANPSVPANNVQELIAYAKRNPGKLAYGSAGNGSGPHVAGELFKSMAGVDLVHVPYKGAAPAVVDLLSGQIQLGFVNISAVLPYVRSGKLKAIAVTTLKRSAALPDLPTVDEQGVKDYDTGSWYGLHAPAGTPPAVIDSLYATMRAVMAEPALGKRLLDTQGAEVVVKSPQEFDRFIRADAARTVPIMKAVSLKKD